MLSMHSMLSMYKAGGSVLCRTQAYMFSCVYSNVGMQYALCMTQFSDAAVGVVQSMYSIDLCVKLCIMLGEPVMYACIMQFICFYVFRMYSRSSYVVMSIKKTHSSVPQIKLSSTSDILNDVKQGELVIMTVYETRYS